MKEELQKARRCLANAEKVVVFSGAGLSAESGVPTFRDKNPDALWSRFDPMQLASIDGFLSDPNRSMNWYGWRRKLLSSKQPNAAHFTLAGMKKWVQVTQNVDDLLEKAGVPPEKIYHLHGEIAKDKCHSNCGFEEKIDLSRPPDLRNCPNCGDLVRPAVVLFGEILPTKVFKTAERLCAGADVLLVVGTSSQVYPAAGLVVIARKNSVPIVVINKDSGHASFRDDLNLIGSAAEILPRLVE